MKTKFEDHSKWILNHKCAVCGTVGKYDLFLSGTYYNPETGEDKDKSTVNCRNCGGRLC